MGGKMECIEVVKRRRVSAYFTILVLANEIEICLSFQPCQGFYVGKVLYFTLERTPTLT